MTRQLSDVRVDPLREGQRFETLAQQKSDMSNLVEPGSVDPLACPQRIP